MPNFFDVQDFFSKLDRKLIIAADAEPIAHEKAKGEITYSIPAGGVGVALEPIARASHAIYIARGKSATDKEVLNNRNEIAVNAGTPDEYLLKRLFFSEEDLSDYYYGFSNQTLWPLCHIAFQRPEFNSAWYEGYKRVNKTYAESIKSYLHGNDVVWINDYQLALVPAFLNKPKGAVVGMFWHIPWPTWEIFRILPQKKELLESMLMCDYIAFHRGYQAQNFINTVVREFEARVDLETRSIHYKNHVTTVKSLPMGIDTDVIMTTLQPQQSDTILTTIVRGLLGLQEKSKEDNSSGQSDIDLFFKQNRVILGVDRLDYTKGLRLRLLALDRFFQEHPEYIGNVSYLGVLSPSREQIPAYKELKKNVYSLTKEINEKYEKDGWRPIHLVSGTYTRPEILNLYRKAQVGLVTPLDDGMNLVSKEFIVAASLSDNPGVLVLSQFAGSAIDLTASLIVNPYNVEEVAEAIHKALTMPKETRIKITKQMVQTLEERNVYGWAMKFVRDAIGATTHTRR